jgi:hypothetical protein
MKVTSIGSFVVLFGACQWRGRGLGKATVEGFRVGAPVPNDKPKEVATVSVTCRSFAAFLPKLAGHDCQV